MVILDRQEECDVRAVVWWSVVAVLTVVGGAGSALGQAYASRVPLPAGIPTIEIWKGERRMQLRQGDEVLREFRISLGRAPKYPKELRGDLRTPVGRYFITGKKQSRFHRFLGLNYPNVEDAERGYARGLLDAAQWADIYLAGLRGDAPSAHTVLGGWIGIHGYGHRPYMQVDWTEGCIAVSNEDAEYLYEELAIGTPVVIHE